MREALRKQVAETWRFRERVEREAAQRFDRLASSIALLDADSPIPQRMRKAANDERRHAELCAGLASEYGATAPHALAPTEIAPRRLGPREAALYEVVAACCITETESVATVTSLLAEDAVPRVREVLHEIARDEVSHSQMGWAHLSRESARGDVSFLAEWIPAMLSGTVDDSLFEPAEEPEELLQHGILPRARKREVFTGALLEVVLPGLERFAIDVAKARAWLAARGR